MKSSKKQIKKPIKKGVAKVPVVMQMEALECGAASLTMVLAYYNKWIPLEQVRSDCGVSRDGSSAKNILKAARNYGLKAQGYRMEPEALRENGTFPCIIHWEFNHFVVVDGFKGDKVYINDPARGNYSITMEAFDESFTGVCIMFEPTDEFVPSGEPKKMLTFAKKRLIGCGVAIAFVFLTTLILSFLNVINPVFSRIFLDKLLLEHNAEWYSFFFLAFAIVIAIQIVTAYIQAIYSIKINGKMAIVGNTSYMWKVLNLPMNFFSQRLAGDIKQRQESNAMISEVFVNTFAPLFINFAMLIFYAVVMFRYSVLLSIVGMLSVVINLWLAKIISSKRVNITRVLMRDEGKLYGTMISGIGMIETIKASGAENGFFEKWSGYQASVNTGNVRFQKVDNFLGILPEYVNAITADIILILGVYLCMTGKFSVGMIMTFQGFFTSFTGPVNTLIGAGQQVQEMRTEMERVDDVMEYPDDENIAAMNFVITDDYSKLSGNIEIKNVTFGYSKLTDPIIKDFSLTIKQGQKIALVGASGCGKSTISKLVSGLYQPWEGEILFDGKPIKEIDRNVFTSSIAVVDQDITLFEDSIANNIRMWDTSIEDFEIIMAARDAMMYDDIMEREGGYDYKLIEGGMNLSGGQRQRLEMARVLAQDPTVIIMDEATSALDAKTEYDVVKAIKDRGITCLVVAHRLSTIRDCDEILVIKDGVIVESGTHDELYASGGYYKDLVTNE